MLEVEEKLTGADLDRAVAERVMGWHEETDHDYTPPQVNWMDEQGNYRAIVNCDGQLPNLPLWKPSESIKAAMQVVEKVLRQGFYIDIHSLNGPRWLVRLQNSDIDNSLHECVGESECDTLPEAICRAVLAAITEQ